VTKNRCYGAINADSSTKYPPHHLSALRYPAASASSAVQNHRDRQIEFINARAMPTGMVVGRIYKAVSHAPREAPGSGASNFTSGRGAMGRSTVRLRVWKLQSRRSAPHGIEGRTRAEKVRRGVRPHKSLQLY
jgi:hypothetical protein